MYRFLIVPLWFVLVLTVHCVPQKLNANELALIHSRIATWHEHLVLARAAIFSVSNGFNSTRLLAQFQEQQRKSHNNNLNYKNHIYLQDKFIRKANAQQQATHSATCNQAWIGPGTGAWFRIDTLCNNSNWFKTSAQLCFPPRIDDAIVADPKKDGLFQSLGIYNTVTGAGADIGFTAVPMGNSKRVKWVNYAASSKGWVSGSIEIDPQGGDGNCIIVMVDVLDIKKVPDSLHNAGSSADSIGIEIVALTISPHTREFSLAGVNYIPASELDKDLLLNSQGKNIGFYRFDSIAQNAPETLSTGSKLQFAVWKDWSLYGIAQQQNAGDSIIVVPVTESLVAMSNHGYKVGPCCSSSELSTVTVHGMMASYSKSNVTIKY